MRTCHSGPPPSEKTRPRSKRPQFGSPFWTMGSQTRTVSGPAARRRNGAPRKMSTVRFSSTTHGGGGPPARFSAAVTLASVRFALPPMVWPPQRKTAPFPPPITTRRPTSRAKTDAQSTKSSAPHDVHVSSWPWCTKTSRPVIAPKHCGRDSRQSWRRPTHMWVPVYVCMRTTTAAPAATMSRPRCVRFAGPHSRSRRFPPSVPSRPRETGARGHAPGAAAHRSTAESHATARFIEARRAPGCRHLQDALHL